MVFSIKVIVVAMLIDVKLGPRHFALAVMASECGCELNKFFVG
jgi:hypothetical protein